MLKKIVIGVSLVALLAIILSYLTIGSLLISTEDVCTEYCEENMAAIAETNEIQNVEDLLIPAAELGRSGPEKKKEAEKESRNTRKKRELSERIL